VLYLARVSKKNVQKDVLAQLPLGQVPEHCEVQLLAQHKAPDWVVLDYPLTVLTPAASPYNIGVLVVVELDERQHIVRVEDAVPLITQLLTAGSTHPQDYPAPSSQQPELSPETYRAELAEIEQWRQTLTRQSQDLRQREAEIEARQEELQQWEIELRRLKSDR
jgi:hypothetical protein